MLTGTVVNYYRHCRRQCWLFYHKLNMEDNSEDVRIGRVLHALSSEKEGELAIDNIRLDKITDEYVVEMKKSDADLDAALIQELSRHYAEIEEFLLSPVPPAPQLKTGCKRCAYYEYCYI